MNDELNILEMRLTELQEIDRLVHVLIEAPVNHQGKSKPLYYAENRSRFSAWNDRIIHVVADGLPSAEQDPNPWSREHGQREYARLGLREAEPGDIVLHGDLDEIPRAWAAEHDPGAGTIGMSMRDHAFAVDWLGPEPFRGTVITRLQNVRSFTELRYMRNLVPLLPDAGWHINCMGGPDAIRKKLDSFCHLEMKGMLERGINGGYFYERGMRWGPGDTLDNPVQLEAVDVDVSWPRWIREGKAPASWYRPRGEGESRV
jgi:beta-1,4-mannosyl-glycoprotein beta-1,4-N-acetylglucosaminyltransferase